MATVVVMPRQGNTVESCVIAQWRKAAGDAVKKGEPLLDIETDKALMEVESPADGTLLAIFAPPGAEVPVMANIAVIGQAGESVEEFRPAGTAQAPTSHPSAPQTVSLPATVPAPIPQWNGGRIPISPRARGLAAEKGVDVTALSGSGPEGRIIERDVQAALQQTSPMTRTARYLAPQGAPLPANGSGLGGRITTDDLRNPLPQEQAPTPPQTAEEDVRIIPMTGVRKVTAQRMLQSLQTTAQLTLNASADARALLDYRKRLKASPEALGLQTITINDLVLFAVSRVLPEYPDLNATLSDNTIMQYKRVHLGFAVDAPRGLLVPVIQRADTLSLKALAAEAKRLAGLAAEGKLPPDVMTGGTFTVSNLGSFGIESFTPVLNPPQVAILGVGGVHLKPVERDGEVQFIPHLALSLTIDHQAVDGAPGARFLQALSQAIANFDLLLAMGG
ncbi:MAG: dihydrolipoamide acetyltransferase family protein [bacterium]|nr:dihydrolipoamide acetyltransferase family protein [bacterium]